MAKKPDTTDEPLDNEPVDEFIEADAKAELLNSFRIMMWEDICELAPKVAEIYESRRDERRAELLAQLEALDGKPVARPKPAGEKRGAVAPKYRSLKNPELVWGGRGQKSRWLVEEMQETGKPLEAFLIK